MLESKYKHCLSFHVEGLPPWKASPGPSKIKYAPQRKESVETLQRKAFSARDEEIFFSNRVALAIRYHRVKSERDAANILGGIADALQGILYKNDSVLVEIHYAEDLGVTKDEYWVEVAKVE